MSTAGLVLNIQKIESTQQQLSHLRDFIMQVERSFTIYMGWPVVGVRSVNHFIDWLFENSYFDVLLQPLLLAVDCKMLYHVIFTLPLDSGWNKSNLLDLSFDALNQVLVNTLSSYFCFYMLDIDLKKNYHIHVLAFSGVDLIQMTSQLENLWNSWSGGSFEVIEVQTHSHASNLLRYFMKKLTHRLGFKHYCLPMLFNTFYWLKELFETYLLLLNQKNTEVGTVVSDVGKFVSDGFTARGLSTDSLYEEIKNDYLDTPKKLVCSQIDIEKITQANIVEDVFNNPKIPISYRNLIWLCHHLVSQTCDKFLVSFFESYKAKSGILQSIKIFFKRRRKEFLSEWFKEFYSACVVCIIKSAVSESTEISLLENIHTQLLIRLKYILKTKLDEFAINSFVGNIKLAEHFYMLTLDALDSHITFVVTSSRGVGLNPVEGNVKSIKSSACLYVDWVCDNLIELNLLRVVALHRTQAKIKYPLVCRPKPWRILEIGRRYVASAGGYLCNSLLHDFPLVHIGSEFKHRLSFWDQSMIGVVNYLQNISFVRDISFEFWLRNYMSVPSKDAWVEYTQMTLKKLSKISGRLSDLNAISKDDLLGVPDKDDIRVFRINRLRLLRTRIQQDYSKRSVVREYLDGIETISELSNCFYFTYFYDFRGRLYSHSSLHPQNSHYARAGLRFLERGLFVESVFIESWMQLYKKCSASQALNIFNDLRVKLDKGLSVASEIKPENPERFFVYWLEYMKYLEAKKQNITFLTNLICYIDARSSGPQLLSLLSQDSTYAVELHLLESDYDTDFYVTIVQAVCESYCSEKVSSVDEQNLQKKLLDINSDPTKGFAYLRKLLKRSVMTEFYGCTKSSFVSYVLDGAKKLSGVTFTKKELLIFAKYAYLKTRDLSLISIKTLIMSIVTSVMSEERGFSWNVLDKYTIRMHYTKTKIKRVSFNKRAKGLTADVKKRMRAGVQKLNVAVGSDVLNKRKMRNSCVPNIIQSFDAVVLHYLVLSAQNAKKPIVCIHDCIGCLFEDVDWFRVEIQKIYRKIYDADILYEEFMNNLPPKLRHLRGVLRKFKQAGFDSLREKVVGYGILKNSKSSLLTNDVIQRTMCYSKNIYEYED